MLRAAMYRSALSRLPQSGKVVSQQPRQGAGYGPIRARPASEIYGCQCRSLAHVSASRFPAGGRVLREFTRSNFTKLKAGVNESAVRP